MKFLINEFDKKSNIKTVNVIQTKSNLRFKVLEEILFIIGIDKSEFTARIATILLEENIEFDIDVLDTYVLGSYPDILLIHHDNNRDRLLSGTQGRCADCWGSKCLGPIQSDCLPA